MRFDAARALDETDDSPGQVVVHDHVGVLEILALAKHVGGDQDAKLPLRFALARPLVAVRAESPCRIRGVGRVAGNSGHVRHPSLLELRFQVVNRVSELREHQHLLVWEGLRKQRVERVELGVLGRVPVPVGLEYVQGGH